MDRAFVDAVRGIGDDVRAPYAEALRTHRLACALAASAATGQPVRPAETGGGAPAPATRRTPGEPMTDGPAAMADPYAAGEKPNATWSWRVPGG